MSEKLRSFDQLNNSSILERVVHIFKEYRGTQDPDEPKNIRIVDVVKMDGKKEDAVVIVQFQLGDEVIARAFGVKAGESFGAADEQPLSTQEFNLVMSMARYEQL